MHPPFVDYDPNSVITAAWLNDVNTAVYQALGTGGVAPTTPAQVISNLGLTTLLNVRDAPFNAVGNGIVDDTAAFNAFMLALQAQGDYASGIIPSTPVGYLLKGMVSLPNTNGWCLLMHGVKIIFAPTAGGTDCLASSNIWANSSNDAQLLGRPLIYTASANARYGVSWVALNRSHFEVEVQGFSASGSAGFFTDDSLDVDGYLKANYNYYGLLQGSHVNTPMNAWKLDVSLENNTQSMKVFNANGLQINTIVHESNASGIDVRSGSGVAIGTNIGNYLGEGNGNYDVRLGIDGVVNGAFVSGLVNSILTGVVHYPIALYTVSGFTHNCNLANGSAFVHFALPGGVSNSYFGSLSFSPGTSNGDPTQNPPVDNLYGGCTYAGIAADPGFLTRNNIIADYQTFVNNSANLCHWDAPFNEFVLGGSGTPTWLRSPNTGVVPDMLNGRPCGLLTIGAAPVSTNLSATFPMTTASGFNNTIVTFAVDMEIPFGSTPVCTMYFDNGSGGYPSSVTYVSANGTNVGTYYVSGYVGVIANLRCIIDGFTTNGVYKIGNFRVFTGLDPRLCSKPTGPVQFTRGGVAPTTGTHAQGDIVWNGSAAAGGVPGFVCTTAGTGGGTLVYKPMANLGA